ncbi:MAG: hypothetical protein HRU19_10470 [Pseudobacteriovorax sp.]|nr:hypothetical protein [Pseudobacteriovorax sp.]
MVKHALPLWICLFYATLIQGCGVDEASTLTIDLFGANAAPEGATGDKTPFRIDMTLESIGLVLDSTTDVEAFSGPASVLQVIDRPQIILEYSLTNYVDSTITAINVTFSNGVTLYEGDNTITGNLETPVISYTTPIVIETGRSESLDMKISWKNIITDQSFSQPTVVLSEN